MPWCNVWILFLFIQLKLICAKRLLVVLMNDSHSFPSVCFMFCTLAFLMFSIMPLPLSSRAVGSCGRRNLKSQLVRRQLKHSPFKAWSRSVYSHTCYAYCQEFLPGLFLPFWSTHLYFVQTSSWFFLVLAVANTGSCVSPQNEVGQPVGCRFPCWVPVECK